MEIGRCLFQFIFFASISFGQSNYLTNTHWVEKVSDCSDYFPCINEYLFYSNGRFLEKSIVKNGTISSITKGEWKFINDSLYLFPDTILSYSERVNIYFRKTKNSMMSKQHYKVKFKNCLLKPKLFFSQENEDVKVRRKFKKQRVFNDDFVLKAKIEDVEYLDTTQ